MKLIPNYIPYFLYERNYLIESGFVDAVEIYCFEVKNEQPF